VPKKMKGNDTMAGDTKSHHQFVVSNDARVVIRYCNHCGLSHQMESYPEQPMGGKSEWVWNLILEEREDVTFSGSCPGECGSDDLFPYHHFILSNHHRQGGGSVVIRFCVRCGLSHRLDWMTPRALGIEFPYAVSLFKRIPIWQHIKESETDMTVSDLCPVEQGSDASKRRYLPVLKN
jgi:hypothetical protein